MHTPFALTASRLVLAVLAVGCSSSSSETADPTSAAALKKADSIEVSCSYTEHYSSDGYGAVDTPSCDNRMCLAVEADENSVDFGDGSSMYDTDLQQFLGSCTGERTPVSCDDFANDGDACDACLAAHCCISTFLCNHDPNCQAISDCVTSCKDDSTCAQRCVENGDYQASKDFTGTVQCMTGTCADACATK